MKKLIISLDENFKKHENTTKKVLKGLEKLFDLKTKYVEVYLVGNKFMEKNVLSFPAPKDFPRPDVKNYETLGEIYLNPIYIENHNEDFTFMLIHGFLHLLGYDHKIKSDAIIMEGKEADIMAQLSIADINIADGKQ